MDHSLRSSSPNCGSSVRAVLGQLLLIFPHRRGFASPSPEQRWSSQNPGYQSLDTINVVLELPLDTTTSGDDLPGVPTTALLFVLVLSSPTTSSEFITAPGCFHPLPELDLEAPLTDPDFYFYPRDEIFNREDLAYPVRPSFEHW
jgi:hypothetical protein